MRNSGRDQDVVNSGLKNKLNKYSDYEKTVGDVLRKYESMSPGCKIDFISKNIKGLKDNDSLEVFFLRTGFHCDAEELYQGPPGYAIWEVSIDRSAYALCNSL